ncbi:hypothetical protein AVEN_186368-1 [Araneus ventricosus]|uniref:Histone-lysine N-methyltransferase SETMAR n=1 Tax=Araneus ventricosus TaxID=182803 RepID=A0A4Y2VDD9_ARAVE|nr:hypothetical protein AVEN_186368-1 [Araneus ventricosus]
MNHPPYSPDLSPIDIHTFLHLKLSLSDKRFDDVGKLKDAVPFSANFYDVGMEKFRFDKCLNVLGDHVGKASNVCKSLVNMYLCSHLSPFSFKE